MVARGDGDAFHTRRFRQSHPGLRVKLLGVEELG